MYQWGRRRGSASETAEYRGRREADSILIPRPALLDQLKERLAVEQS